MSHWGCGKTREGGKPVRVRLAIGRVASLAGLIPSRLCFPSTHVLG